MHHRAIWPLVKRSRRAFRGYPLATVAFYGPDDRRASKVAVGIVPSDGAAVTALERWFSDEADVRSDEAIARRITDFIDRHDAKSVVVGDRIIGCPHEEGADYPEGAVCPHCPFWAHRDRWTGEPEGLRGRVVGGIRRAALDAASLRKEIDYLVGRAGAGEERLVTLGPLLFFTTSTGDAWMLDPADGHAACLARDGVEEPVEIADEGEQFAIDWPCSYRIDGEAMTLLEHSTGRARTVLGYPCKELQAAARRMSH